MLIFIHLPIIIGYLILILLLIILAAIPINLISTISIAEFLEVLLPVYNPSSGSLRLLLLLLLPSLPPSLCNSPFESVLQLYNTWGRNLSPNLLLRRWAPSCQSLSIDTLTIYTTGWWQRISEAFVICSERHSVNLRMSLIKPHRLFLQLVAPGLSVLYSKEDVRISSILTCTHHCRLISVPERGSEWTGQRRH